MTLYNDDVLENIKHINDVGSLSYNHSQYLKKIKKTFNFEPKTIYDIGSCVLHWTKEAKTVWEKSEIILFDASDIFEQLYISSGYKYSIQVISDITGKQVKFYQNNYNFSGNSYYKENFKYSPLAKELFTDSNIKILKTKTLDDLVFEKEYALPDLIKIDVQGAELDVLYGADRCIKNTKHIIIELRNIEYNVGSPDAETIIKYLENKGFKNIGMFCDNGPDSDYHFIKL